MYGVELYAAVRLAVVDEGLSHHEAARRFGIDRPTVKKIGHLPGQRLEQQTPFPRPQLAKTAREDRRVERLSGVRLCLAKELAQISRGGGIPRRLRARCTALHDIEHACHGIRSLKQ